MKIISIFAAIGIFTFAICYLLVYPVGAQFVKIAPSTEPVINFGVSVICLLMTIHVVLKIYDLFYPKRGRR
jgi:hypothetical protein